MSALNDDVEALKESFTEGLTLNDIGPAGRTPIHVACVYLHRDWLRAALQHDFDPDIKDDSNYTAFDYALRNCMFDVCLALTCKARGENPDIYLKASPKL